MKAIQQFFQTISRFPYAPQLLLLLLMIIGYWQVSTFHFSMKYDMIDCYYPWRYMVGESLQNGMLPLWNPYQTLGYPLHADPQSGAWYPFAWIIGGLWGYDIFSLEFEFLLHVYFAGTGMYFLGRILKLSRSSAFMIATAYMFSGFMIGNAQHFTWIISAAWIPYILGYFIKFTESGKYMHAMTAGFFMYLLVSGGYPAFTVILCYLLLMILIFYMVPMIKKKEWKKLVLFLKLNSAFLISSILFSAVVLVSVSGVTAYITRGTKLPVELALFCPLSPQCLVSFILPFSVIKDMAFFGTDLSMSNIYFGLPLFLFFTLSLFIRKPSLVRIFLWFGIFCLTAALGEYLPVRKFLYDYFPMMGFFRFPSLFRLFTIISFLVAAGFAFDNFFLLSSKKKKNILFVIIPTSLILIAAVAYSRMQGYLTITDFIKHHLFVFSESSTIWQHIAFQSLIQLALLSLMIVAIFKIKDAVLLKRIFIFIAVTDLIFASWLNEPYTAYSNVFTTKSTKEISNAFPQGFPVPSVNDVLMNNDTSGLSKGTFWKNMNIFHKQIAWDGFTPFKSKGYEIMLDSFPEIFRSTLSNPPVFLSDRIFPPDSMKMHDRMKMYDPGSVYLDSAAVFTGLCGQLKKHQGDTVIIENFTPSEIVLRAETKESQLLCLLQNNYTGWTAKVNSEETNIYTFSKGLMCVQIPAGKSTVTFLYKNNSVLISLYVSAVSILLFGIFLLINKFRR